MTEHRFLPFPPTVLGGNETRVLEVIPLVGGELRALLFPVDTLDRLHVGRVECDGRSALGRLTRRGVLFLCCAFLRGSRLSVTVTNLRSRETPVHGFKFSVHHRVATRAEVVAQIETLGRQLQGARSAEQVAELKRQLAQLERMLG